MKKFITFISFLVVAGQSMLAMAGVNVDVNIGFPQSPPPVVVAPPPAYAPPPVAYQQPPEVVYDSQPRFIFSPALGFYVTVDVPYDIVYIDNGYYFYSGGIWYVGPTYGGPWVVARRRALPRPLKRYRYDQIRYYRDAEYRIYQRDPRHYLGRLYEPVWQSRKVRRDEMREPHRENLREPHREDMREPYRGEERRDERR